MTIPVEGLSAQLGVSRGDILSAIKWFVYVEGEHDAAILRALFSEPFRLNRAKVIEMHGARNVEAQITSDQLLAYSDARIRIVLDRIGASAMKAWTGAQEAFVKGDHPSAMRALNQLAEKRDRESQWLAEAGMAALRRGTLDRIDVVGLRLPDIIQYLPVEDLVPGATAWDPLVREWRAAPSPKPDFKQWIRKVKGARFTSKTLAEVAERMTDLDDLTKVVDGL